MSRRPRRLVRSDLARRLRRRTAAAPGVLLFAQVVHVVGDASVAAALASTLFFDVPVGEARTEVALYLALAFAPYTVLMPVVAPLLSRRAEAHGAMVVVADVGRALLAVLLVSQYDTLWLYPLGFGILVLSRAHAVSRASLVPRLVDDDDLLDANAAISLVSGAAGFAGGGLGLAAAALGGPAAALVLAAGVHGAGSLSGLWLSPPAGAADEQDGAEVLLSDERSRGVLIAATACRAALGFTGTLLAFTFHGGDDRIALGVSLGALGLGGWAATFAVGVVRRIVGRGRLSLAAAAALVPLPLALLALDDVALAALVGAWAGFAATTARLGFDAHIQQRLPPGARGRGYARYETVLQLGWVAGAAPASLFALPLDAGVVAVSVIGLLGVALVMAGRPAAGKRS